LTFGLKTFAKGELLMQKNLCIGLGIALFGVATVLYFGANVSSSYGIRTVNEAEAMTVCGGGNNGNNYSDRHCGESTDGCTAYGSMSDGPSPSPGGKWANSVVTCGGSCGNVVTSFRQPPE
jgi:hypothetical protein